MTLRALASFASQARDGWARLVALGAVEPLPADLSRDAAAK